MTILELIDRLEEVEDLDVVLISKDGICRVYEGDDIDFINEDDLSLQVKDYLYGVRSTSNNRRRYTIVDIKT